MPTCPRDGEMARGKLIKQENIKTPLGDITIETKEYPQFMKRSKVIFWLGNLKAVLLGHLVTTYHVKSRKSDFEPIKYEPLYYRVKLTEDADASDVEPYHYGGADDEGNFDFDGKEEAEEFVNGLKCKTVPFGVVCLDTETEFNHWKKVLEKIAKEIE